MSQIEYLYDKKIQNLETLFSFSSIKDKINNEISNIYNTSLLPALILKAKYNPGDEGISDYDFPTTISNNIDLILNTNIQKTKEIINKMKGNNYIIEDYDYIPDFSYLPKEEFQQIQNNFNNFSNSHSTQEEQQILEVILENLKTNFNSFINNFIPSFGIDFFDSILKYNEIQKIKSLYSNLKYSLTVTLIYYMGLCDIHPNIMFPDNLKYKILSLNDIKSTIRSNNNKILSSLNSKFEEYIKDTKNYIVEKYISEIKTDPYIINSFDSKISLYINQTLNGYRNHFEDEYINKTNNYIKRPFIQEYSKTLNKETNEMLYFIEKNVDKAKVDLNEIFTLKPDDILSEIENKLNSTLKAVESYNLHFNSFNIPDKVKKFLEEYISNIISPKYEEINNILNDATKELIEKNLEINSENFKNSYNFEEFESKNNEIIVNLTNSFDKINASLSSYGKIESVYSENLEKEISKYNRIRNLDELDEDKIVYKRRIADLKLDETFQEIENYSSNLLQFIESLNLFKEFEEKINKYINEINYQSGISQNVINRITKNNKDNYEKLDNELNILKSYSLQYYNNVNSCYQNTKEKIHKLIDEINEIIGNCSNITFQTLANKYEEYLKTFNSVNDTVQKEDEFNMDHYEMIEKKNYSIISNIQNYVTDNEIKLNVTFEDGEIKKPKIVGKFINRNRPKNLEIELSSDFGETNKFITKITPLINNISFSVDFNFDICSNKGLFNIKTDFDEYEIIKSRYQTSEKIESTEVSGIIFQHRNRDKEQENKEGEEVETISAKKNETNFSYNFQK